MDELKKLNRRRFIALSVFGASGMCLLSRCANPPLSRWRFLAELESVLLDYPVIIGQNHYKILKWEISM